MDSTSSRPDPKLLSFLEKLIHPIDQLTLKLSVSGIYCFPEEWKSTDEANPTLYTYQVKMNGLEISDGKIFPRQLTDKELKEIEEAQAAKNKKKEKKDPKNEPPPPSFEELEKQRRLKEEQEEEERKRLAEWNALDDQTRFYRTYEDKYKHPFIKFENNEVQAEKSEEALVIFEDRVNEDKGDWLYFVKQVMLSEEEIAKLKKAKPKNADLYNSIVTKTWVDYSPFLIPGTTETTQRCKLEIHYDLKEGETPPADQKTLENTYIYLKISLDSALYPLIKEIQPKAEDLIPKPQPIMRDPPAVECINEFRADLAVIIESLGMEYANSCGKELNAAAEQKAKNTLTVQKKAEINNRKEKFLYEFNIYGKYKILKERLKKSIVRICRDKFQKMGSITGITTDQKDQFYSELYVFLIEEMRHTLGEIIKNKREELHEDVVVCYDQTLKERDKIVAAISKETPEEILLKLATEYEILNNMEMAEKNFKNLMKMSSKNPKNWLAYARFCIRNKNFPKAEEGVTESLTYDPQSIECKELMICLYIRRGRYKEALIFLKSLIENDLFNTKYNSLISFIYGTYLNDIKLSKKYHAISERVFMRNAGLLQPKATHRTYPNPFELPDYKAKSIAAASEVKKGPQLSNDQQDDIYTEIIDFFCRNQMFDLVERSLSLLFDKTTHKALIFQSHIMIHKGRYEEAVALCNKVIEYSPKNYDVLLMKSSICFLSDKFYECEDTFFKAMKLKGQKNFSIYLRLGEVYLKRKAWGDAKAIFAKACELKNNSPLAWLGLGISSLRSGDYKEAEEALSQSNIYDPLNYRAWGYLALLCLKDGNRFIQANQSLREMFKTEILTTDTLIEISDELIAAQKFELAETCLQKILNLSNSNIESIKTDIGPAYIRLGKIYSVQNKTESAKNAWENALDYIEGEGEKEKIHRWIENLDVE